MPSMNGEAKQTWNFRVSPQELERIRMQSKRLGRKSGIPVTMVEVLRKCISLGLAQLERGK